MQPRVPRHWHSPTRPNIALSGRCPGSLQMLCTPSAQHYIHTLPHCRRSAMDCPDCRRDWIQWTLVTLLHDAADVPFGPLCGHRRGARAIRHNALAARRVRHPWAGSNIQMTVPALISLPLGPYLLRRRFWGRGPAAVQQAGRLLTLEGRTILPLHPSHVGDEVAAALGSAWLTRRPGERLAIRGGRG